MTRECRFSSNNGTDKKAKEIALYTREFAKE